MDKPKILLLTHGGWGMDLVHSLNMILGNIDCCEELPLRAEHTFADYYELVADYVANMPKGSLILTDMFGGTTTSVGAKVGSEEEVRVLCGLSAPLLLEACSQIQFQGEMDFDLLLETGSTACRDVVAEIMKNMEKQEK